MVGQSTSADLLKIVLCSNARTSPACALIRHPDDESTRVSHETIYHSLFIQARGVLKKS